MFFFVFFFCNNKKRAIVAISLGCLKCTADSGLHGLVDAVEAFAKIGRHAGYVPAQAESDVLIGGSA